MRPSANVTTVFKKSRDTYPKIPLKKALGKATVKKYSVSSNHASTGTTIWGLLTAYSFPQYHMGSHRCLFILIQGHSHSFHARPCTATDRRRSSLHARRCFPGCFIIVPFPFVIVPQRLIFIFALLHSLLTTPLFPLSFYRFIQGNIYYVYNATTIHII